MIVKFKYNSGKNNLQSAYSPTILLDKYGAIMQMSTFFKSMQDISVKKSGYVVFFSLEKIRIFR